MVYLQSDVNLSPRGVDKTGMERDESGGLRSSTLGVITSKLANFSLQQQQQNAQKLLSRRSSSLSEEALFRIKIKIIVKNPAIFQIFKERLVEMKLQTHWSIGATIHGFVAKELKIPDLKSDIKREYNRRRNRPRGRLLLSYLTGLDSSPQIVRRVPCRRSSSMASITSPIKTRSKLSPRNRRRRVNDIMDDLSVQTDGLSLPSLDATDDYNAYSDDESTFCADSQSGRSSISSGQSTIVEI